MDTRTRRLSVFLVPVLALALVGCSSGGGGSSEVIQPQATTSQKVTNVMQGVVLPTLAQLGFDSGEVNANSPNAAGGVAPRSSAGFVGNAGVTGSGGDAGDASLGGDGCFPTSGICASGSYDLCFEESGLRFAYDTCDRPAGVIDGSWTFSWNNGWVTEYALSIGNLDLSGAVSLTEDASCLVHDLGPFTATRPEVTTSLDGQISYCPDVEPVGGLELLVVDDESSFRMTLDLTDEGASVIVEFETSSESCTVDIGSGEADCEEQV